MSLKVSIFVPSMAAMMSPLLIPAFSAALPAFISPTRGSFTGTPIKANTLAKIRIERMKLAIGPAATTAARFHTGLP
jgi:hypothetical protein